MDEQKPQYENRKMELVQEWPKFKWLVWFLIIWVAVGLTPLLVTICTHLLCSVDDNSIGRAGQIGDAFGMVNSLFSSAALLFVIWSIKLQRQEITFAQQEWTENTESQKEQARLMSESAKLTAINHIYQHYGHDYGKSDAEGILGAIAEGHRRWAIRETFDSIDDSFGAFRVKQVQDDFIKLKKHLSKPSQDRNYLRTTASLISSLLIDKRLSPEDRTLLWPLYELLRQPSGEEHVTKGSFSEFERLCKTLNSNIQ